MVYLLIKEIKVEVVIKSTHGKNNTKTLKINIKIDVHTVLVFVLLSILTQRNEYKELISLNDLLTTNRYSL